MEAVGQLTGGLAHDFNNLLTGVMGNLELLSRKVSAGKPEGLERYIAGAQGAGRRAASLTQRLLAFARRQTLDPTPTDVNRLASGMLEMVERTVGPAIALDFVGAPDPWVVNIDSGQLENALLNVCINARDAMPGGGRLTIETSNETLDEVSAREKDMQPGDYLMVCVTDTGTGMSPETIRRAFEPFYTTKPLGQGTGLGLSMIYGFARQSGGGVHIESQLGRGSEICIYLPRYDGAAETKDEAGSSSDDSHHGNGHCVLVVDDETAIRQLLVEVLLEQSYSVLSAPDGPSGLKILQGGAQVEPLITDVGLPNGMNGRQVAEAAREIIPDLPVLFITGYAESAALDSGDLDEGMSLLTKPFSLDALAEKVRVILEA
jgi:CheY-like chemotaxis protein